MADKFVNSLLPRSVLIADTFDKLTAALQDVKTAWQGMLDKIRNAYDLDKLTEDELIELIKSFSLEEIYNAMPPYFHGATHDSNGVLYSITPVDKLVWMRDFLNTMLKLRQNIGVPEFFDQVMGLLKVPDEQFVILQNFDYYDGANHLILPRRIYSKLSVADLALKGYVYEDAPLANQMVGSSNFYTPTQTVSIDILVGIANQLGDEFMSALRVLVYFLKPTHVIIQDISQAVFLYTDGFYNINLSQRNMKYNTDYEFSVLGKTVNTVAATNRITGTGFLAEGWQVGMVVSVTGLTVVVDHVRIEEVAATYLTLNTDDVTLANEVGVSVNLIGDYDHSFQDALVPFNGKTFSSNVFFTVATNRIGRTAGNFLVDGFKVGAKVTTEGFGGNNNIRDWQEARITLVQTNYITLDKNILTTVLPTPAVKTIRLWDDDFAETDMTISKPVYEKTSNTRHPVIHQPGMLPTLATKGSYQRSRASARLEILDTTHYNNLNSRAGGQVYFGFCITGNFTMVNPNQITRASGSWIADGFEMGCYISTTGFVNGANNTAFKKITGITTTTLTVDPTAVAFINEVGIGVQVCVDMLPTIS